MECCSGWAAECSNKTLQKQMKAAMADIKKGLKALSKAKSPAQKALAKGKSPAQASASQSAPPPSYLSQMINLLE